VKADLPYSVANYPETLAEDGVMRTVFRMTSKGSDLSLINTIKTKVGPTVSQRLIQSV